MARRREVYGPVENEGDLHRVFGEIREDVEAADSRAKRIGTDADYKETWGHA